MRKNPDERGKGRLAMGLWDRLLGTRVPARRVEPAGAPELRARLLGLNRPDMPWQVRDGSPEDLDLVAEWRVNVPGWEFYHLKILMRLDVVHHQVQALDQVWSYEQGHGVRYGQGGSTTRRSATWTLERDHNGKRRWVKERQFDTRALNEPLRDTVIALGWTWKARILRP